MNTADLPYQIFNDSWALYKKVVAADYMHHRMFTQCALNTIEKMRRDSPLEILDIGCGDATPVLPIINNIALKRYTGYDISGVALKECAANLSLAKMEVDLKEGDMSLLIQQEESKFDLIYSSYAIHHLSDAEKFILLKHIASKLNPGGRFIYIDIVRREGKSLTQFRNEYSDNVLHWNSINEMGKKMVIDHINQFDFPATLPDMENWISEASLQIDQLVNGDDKHIFLSLKKQ